MRWARCSPSPRWRRSLWSRASASRFASGDDNSGTVPPLPVELVMTRPSWAPPTVAPPRRGLNVSALYAEHGAFVFRALRRMGVPVNDVADATQQTFLVVHRQANEVRLETPVRAWLFGICVRVAKDWRGR